MGHRAQKSAVATDRTPATARGTVRFELRASEADRNLIRTLARKLVEEGPDAGRIRRVVQQAIAGEAGEQGGILTALRRSPLVGADLDLARPRGAGRNVRL